jgi:hypothetical protein
MQDWDPDNKRYREPVTWWDMLTPRGQLWFAIFLLACFTLLMVIVGTVQTWGS